MSKGDFLTDSDALPSVSVLFERTNEEYPFEDEFGKFYLTTEHFFQASKFLDTDPSFAEHIRLTGTAEEAKKLAKSSDHPPRDDWAQVKDRIMEKALQLKFSSHKDLKALLLSTPPKDLMCNISNEYWGTGINGTGENCYGKLLVSIKDQFLQGNANNEVRKPTKTKRKPRKAKRGRKNIYKMQDGTVTFDMVSSDTVRVSVTDEDIVIPMSALPGRAKTVAKNYQYYKKNNPESYLEDEEDSENSDDIDPDCEEFIYHRVPEAEPEQPAQFADELLTLIELGYTDCDANYAALVSSEGNLHLALDYLS